MPTIPQTKISRRAATRLLGGHQWVYRSDLTPGATLAPASLVHVLDERGRALGSALYSSSSQIALRLISRQQLHEDALLPLLAERIRRAVAYRERVVRDSNACRLIFSEADELPGLIVDRCNDVLSVQILTQAMDRADIREVVLATLQESCGKDSPQYSVYERVEPRIRELEALPPRESGLLHGKKTATEVEMNGVRFRYDAAAGQKTGAFLDQRENYAAAAHHGWGDALDMFTYQGGFALHLAKSKKSKSVTAVDSSRPALEVADANAALNGVEVEWVEANAFDLLKEYSATGKQYDTIVLDPPAFAKSKANLPTAIRGYKELNLRALKMLRPGGILVTCSCSFHVSAADMIEMLASAAADARRSVRILEVRGAALDHPYVATMPETHYLKCLICYVV